MMKMIINETVYEAGGINKPLELHYILLKSSEQSYICYGYAANMLGLGRFPICCMKWQHAVILEPDFETESNKNFLYVMRTGLLTPHLTGFSSSAFPIYLDKIILSLISLSPFYLEKIILSPNSLLFLIFFDKNKPESIFKSISLIRDNIGFCLSRKLLSIDQNFYKIISGTTFFLTY